MSAHNLLQNVYLFKEMTPAELDKVNAVAKAQNYNPGDEVFGQGDQAQALYVIKFGSVKIRQTLSSGNEIDVATMGTGSHFGEMAFVDGEKRSATVLALESTEIVALDFKELSRVLAADAALAMKFYKSLSHFLCGRLRLTTNDLTFSREKNLRHF